MINGGIDSYNVDGGFLTQDVDLLLSAAYGCRPYSSSKAGLQTPLFQCAPRRFYTSQVYGNYGTAVCAWMSFTTRIASITNNVLANTLNYIR